MEKHVHGFFFDLSDTLWSNLMQWYSLEQFSVGYLQVAVEGSGKACASGEAEAQASATVWASVISKAIIRVLLGDPDYYPALKTIADSYTAAMIFGTAEVNRKMG